MHACDQIGDARFTGLSNQTPSKRVDRRHAHVESICYLRMIQARCGETQNLGFTPRQTVPIRQSPHDRVEVIWVVSRCPVGKGLEMPLAGRFGEEQGPTTRSPPHVRLFNLTCQHEGGCPIAAMPKMLEQIQSRAVRQRDIDNQPGPAGQLVDLRHSFCVRASNLAFAVAAEEAREASRQGSIILDDQVSSRRQRRRARDTSSQLA